MDHLYFKFREWYDSPSSKQLILFGYMGCGKTVVTAHVIEELIRQSEHPVPSSLHMLPLLLEE